MSFRATISPTTTALSVVNQAQASTGALVAATNNPDTAAGGDPTVTVITRGPTAISLASFSASWVKGAPLVHWTTAVEVSSYGFHIYRGLTPSRSDAVRVTAELIPAQGGGSSYSWQDTGASSGQRYWYWLEEVELDGSVNHYGPAATQELTAVGGYRVYLPAVTR